MLIFRHQYFFGRAVLKQIPHIFHLPCGKPAALSIIPTVVHVIVYSRRHEDERVRRDAAPYHGAAVLLYPSCNCIGVASTSLCFINVSPSYPRLCDLVDRGLFQDALDPRKLLCVDVGLGLRILRWGYFVITRSP